MINVAFTPNELRILAYVVRQAAVDSREGVRPDILSVADSVHGFGLDLPKSAASEIIQTMKKEGVVDTLEVKLADGQIPHHQLLFYLHKKLNDMIGLSSNDIDRRVIEPLVKAGLAAKVSSANPLRITGGRSVEITDNFTMYEDAFSIWKDPKTRLYRAGKSKATNNESLRNPEEAAKWIIDLYSGNIKQKKEQRGYR